MNIQEAKYILDPVDGITKVTIKAKIDGKFSFVPISEENSDYLEIIKQVESGEITIADADPIISEE